VKTLSEDTLKRFEKLFELVSAALPRSESVVSGPVTDGRSASEAASVAE
jgi:hypothetical protein